MQLLIRTLSITTFLLVPAGLAAQHPRIADEGSWVRVSTVEGRFVGVLLDQQTDMISLGVPADPGGSVGDLARRALADTLHLPLATLTRAETYHGRKSASGTGALVGAAVGLVLGAISGAATCSDPFFDCEPAEGAVVMGTVTAALAAGVGALVGLAIRSDRWDKVPLDNVQAGLIALPGRRVGLKMAVRF